MYFKQMIRINLLNISFNNLQMLNVLLNSKNHWLILCSYSWRDPLWNNSTRKCIRHTDVIDCSFEAVRANHPLCPLKSSSVRMWCSWLGIVLEILSKPVLEVIMTRRHGWDLRLQPHMSHDFTKAFFHLWAYKWITYHPMPSFFPL